MRQNGVNILFMIRSRSILLVKKFKSSRDQLKDVVKIDNAVILLRSHYNKMQIVFNKTQ